MKKTLTLSPVDLVAARLLCHKACQWPSMAARANVPVAADDSHSNLGWDSLSKTLLSHALTSEADVRIGFCFKTRALVWVVERQLEQSLDLAKCSVAEVRAWVDNQLRAADLQPLQHAVMPYTLPGDENYAGFSDLVGHCSELGEWFDIVQTGLATLVNQQDVAVNNATVRCWPHHFDLGALLMLESGDPESARSISLGFSPGDNNYEEPYFYFSPWPAPVAANLPLPEVPLTWHTDGFVSLVVRVSELAEAGSTDSLLEKALGLALTAGT